MWILERSWWDLHIYCHPLMPKLTVRVERDDGLIRQLSEQVERFNFELKQLVAKLRAMGATG